MYRPAGANLTSLIWVGQVGPTRAGSTVGEALIGVGLALGGGCGRLDFDPQAGDAAAVRPDAATRRRLPLVLDRFVPTEPLSDFPILVRLDTAALPAALLRPDLGNLRFVDADGQALGAEFEPPAPGAGALAPRTFWVQLPRWAGVQTIYAEVDALDQPFAAWTSPWSDAYVTVHHFADLATDATGNGHVVAPVAGTPTIEAGLIGAALGFVRANGDCAEIVDDPSLRPAPSTMRARALGR